MALKHLPENPRAEARAWNLQLGVPGFKYADLNRVRRIEALDRTFIESLRSADAQLAEDLEKYRESGGTDRTRLQESELLIKVAPHLGSFIARLFHIDVEHDELCRRIRDDEVVFRWKRNFVERHILKAPPSMDELGKMDPVELEFAYREVVDKLMLHHSLTSDPERELAVVCTTLQEAIEKKTDSRGEGERAEPLTETGPDHKPALSAKAMLDTVESWVKALAFHPVLADRRKQITSFHMPHRTDYDELVPRIRPRSELPELFMGPPETRRHRDGFDLTDPRYSPRENLR
ncbi:MAG TPA: hypothetical protein VJ837_06350, partial [Candidatus Paceibacterota bacterium]|nr:hypothetical protein [Candidatus Paceibacterota bacterium]